MMNENKYKEGAIVKVKSSWYNQKLKMSSKSAPKTSEVPVPPHLQNYITTCKTQFNDLDDNPSETTCLLCDSKYVLPTNQQDFLTHLFQQHQLVIGDVEKIASLKSYVRYWRMRFKEMPILSTFCVALTGENLKSSSNDDKATPEKFYYLLSDCLSEDKTLRYEIYRAKLEWVLAEQLRERTDTTFKRGCMFCRMEFSGSRIEYVKHLCQKHNILLGKPENLVFIDEYLDKIQNNIEKFICIYCEKKFKDRFVLKEHMRKKLHKQVNPNNKEYDKYYIVNYSHEKPESNRRKPHTEETEDPSGFSSNSEDEDWSDWNNETINFTCLLCPEKTDDYSKTLEHMKTEHKFDFEDITKDMTFYHKVKIVNYIRKQIHTSRCVYCDATADQINLHMSDQNHYKLPSKRVWDQPEFYFPMFETDSFLYSLDTNSDTEEIVPGTS